ncbi:MAG: glycosyltransferase family 2 protein [Candidatus Binatia bacterium]
MQEPQSRAPGSGAADPGVDIVVPVFNEGEVIDAFYERIDRLGLADGLIFVDNASTDDTVARIERYPRARLIRHATNEGYGKSIRDGMLAARRAVIVTIDADLEYPPEAIPALLEALHHTPVVFCSRFHAGAPAMPLFRRIGNRLISGLFNRLFGQRVTDIYTGMRGMRRGAIDVARLHRDGFEFCADYAILLTEAGHTIDEIGVEYTPREVGHSKMRHIPETTKLLAFLVAAWLDWVRRGRPRG